MGTRRWQELVARLSSAGHDSPFLDRLRSRLDVQQAQDDLEWEVRREMADSLARSEDKVNLALHQLLLREREVHALQERGVDTGEGSDRLAAAVAAFNRQRDRARRCLWELVIHREALGLRRNEILRELYPIPPRKKVDRA